MAFDVVKIQNSTSKVRKFLERNSKRPSSNAVHDVRTNARRLATIFLTFGLESKGRVKRVLRNLDEIRKRAGKVRDMDVLTADAISVKHEGEEDCHVRLLEHLGAQRDKHVRKLRRAIQKTTPQLRRDLKQASRRVEKLVKQAVEDPAVSKAMKLALAKSIKLKSNLNRPARLNRTNLHRYRLKVKDLLNVLQLSQSPTDTQFLEKLGEVKDAIGEWHDWEQLIGVARDLSDHAESCKLIKGLEANSEIKYGRALSLTNHLRSEYLGNARNMVSETVLKETTAIASSAVPDRRSQT